MSKLPPLYVSSPLLPDLNKFRSVLQGVWDSRHVTNHGPLHKQFEDRLRTTLKVPTAMLFNNATIGLLSALKMFDIEPGSEVITTPLTFAATPHAIAWNGLKPVFADVNEKTMTLDPESVRKAITSRTRAILAVHVYGTVCDVEELQKIAHEYNLRLIYDAAHAFGVEVDGKGIGTFGDASVFSFHATKLFNTIEGGAITTPSVNDASKIYMLRNFGIKNEEEVVDIGLNGKMNELQAAIGLLNLDIYRDEVQARSKLREKYDNIFSSIEGIVIQHKQTGVSRSEQYYPIRIISDLSNASRDSVYENLKQKGIFARKYFHPICTDFVPYQGFPIVTARRVAIVDTIKTQILCLPFHSGVTDDHVTVIKEAFDPAWSTVK